SAAASGGGVANSTPGAVLIHNTIVAGNQAGTAGPDVSGSLISQGHNLIGSTGGGGGFASTDLLNVAQPLLGSLQDNGGPTQTMALLPGSPAIDAGDNQGHLNFDQRGFDRLVDVAVDIGAFESRGFTIGVVGGDNQSTTLNSPFAAPLVVQVASPFGE